MEWPAHLPIIDGGGVSIFLSFFGVRPIKKILEYFDPVVENFELI